MTEPNWHKVPEAEFNRRRRKALERQRGIDGRDPLQGKRNAIANGAARIFYPRSKPCPVNKGDVFRVRGRDIVIRKVKEGHHEGQEVWAVSFDRLAVRDQPRFLRRGPLPFAEERSDERGGVLPPTGEEIIKAAEESAYVGSRSKSADPDAEVVPSDWEDKGKEARELERKRVINQERQVESIHREVRNLAAKLKASAADCTRVGVDPMPYLMQMQALWAQYEAEIAEAEEDRKAA